MLRARLIFAFSLTILIGGQSVGAEPATESPTPLVRRAFAAEVDGNESLRRALLASAIADFPADAPAHWQAGMVRIDDAWLPVDEAEKRLANTGRVAEYQLLRDRYAGTAAGHVQLARWCRREGLSDREKLHWAAVLRQNPKHREARGRLAVREYRGMLLTKEEIAEHQEWLEKVERDGDVWKPRLTRWKNAIHGRDPVARDDAIRQLRAIADPAALPALEEVFIDADDSVCLEIIQAVARLDERQATEFLLRTALGAKSDTVRIVAAKALRQRSPHGYVPTLLGSFQAPGELSYSLSAYRDFSGISFRVVRDGLQATLVQDYHGYMFFPDRMVGRPFRYAKPMSGRNYQKRLLQVAHELEVSNRRINQWNSRVAAVLQHATNADVDDSPTAWLTWWQTQNELQALEKPIIVWGQQSYVMMYSCFVAGTLVATDVGLRKIEKVRTGDRVLSQDPETGELAYRLVVDTTLRPPSPTLRVHCGSEDIVATLGHPLWVTGKGWRMTKELEIGDRLHGLEGSFVVDAIAEGPEADAYNLVVADFNTYFIGEQRVLVHDNQPRRVTRAVLPGYVPLGE